MFSDGSHTHTPSRRRVGKQGPDRDMKVRMKREWEWDGNENEMKKYLTGTRDGERKKGEAETRKTPPLTHLACNGRTLKGWEKRKTEADRNGQRPAEGGEDRRAWTNLPRRYLSLPRHARTPNLPREGSTHEIRDQWGLVHEKIHPL